VARFAARARELRQRTEAAKTAILSASATATTGDGAVTATVDANGVLTGLQLTPSASDRGMDELARDILTAARTGRINALELARQDVVEIVGPDSAAAAVLLRQERELAEPPNADAGDTHDDGGGFAGRGR
jgi:DNA-binding protein YbaB